MRFVGADLVSARERRGRAAPLQLSPHQRDHALKVTRLREKVEGLHGGQAVAGGQETLQVAHLCRGIAGYVNHGAWAEGEELVEKRFVATLARRVDHDRRVGRREIESGENLRGIAGAK